jgi:hypothetical protein
MRLDPDLLCNHYHDADHLCLRGEPVRVEVVRRPSEVIVDAIERHTEQMLDFLGR